MIPTVQIDLATLGQVVAQYAIPADVKPIIGLLLKAVYSNNDDKTQDECRALITEFTIDVEHHIELLLESSKYRSLGGPGTTAASATLFVSMLTKMIVPLLDTQSSLRRTCPFPSFLRFLENVEKQVIQLMKVAA